MDRLYTCREVAERYGVKLTTVWGWIRQLKLTASKIGRIYRVKESNLLEFEQSNKTVDVENKE